MRQSLPLCCLSRQVSTMSPCSSPGKPLYQTALVQGVSQLKHKKSWERGRVTTHARLLSQACSLHLPMRCCLAGVFVVILFAQRVLVLARPRAKLGLSGSRE